MKLTYLFQKFQVLLIKKLKNFVEGFWDNPHHWVRLGIFTRALRNQNLGNELVGLCETKDNKKIIKSMKSLPVKQIRYVENIVLHKKELRQIDDIIQKYEAGTSIFEIKLPFNYPVTLFHDGLNKINYTGNFSHESIKVTEALKKIYQYLKFFEVLLNETNPKTVVVSHPTNLICSTLIWMSIRRKTPVYVINYEHQHMTIRKENLRSFLKYDQGLPDKNFINKISTNLKKELISVGKNYMSELETGKGGQFSVVKVYGKGNANYESKSLFIKNCKGDIDKPCAVILCSCFPDYPNTYGKSWYHDYVNW